MHNNLSAKEKLCKLLGVDTMFTLSNVNLNSKKRFNEKELLFVIQLVVKEISYNNNINITNITNSLKLEFKCYNINDINELAEVTISIYYFWAPIFQVTDTWESLTKRTIEFATTELVGGKVRGQERGAFNELHVSYCLLIPVLLKTWNIKEPWLLEDSIGMLIVLTIHAFIKQTDLSKRENWLASLQALNAGTKSNSWNWVLENEVINLLSKLIFANIALSLHVSKKKHLSVHISHNTRLRYLFRLFLYLNPANATSFVDKENLDNWDFNYTDQTEDLDLVDFSNEKLDLDKKPSFFNKLYSKLSNKVEYFADHKTSFISKKIVNASTISSKINKVKSIKFIALFKNKQESSIYCWSNLGIHLIPGNIIKLAGKSLLGYTHFSSYTDLYINSKANNSDFILLPNNRYFGKWKLPLFLDKLYLKSSNYSVSKLIINKINKVPKYKQSAFYKRVCSLDCLSKDDYYKILNDTCEWATTSSKLLAALNLKHKTLSTENINKLSLEDQAKYKKQQNSLTNAHKTTVYSNDVYLYVKSFQLVFTLNDVLLDHDDAIYFSVAYDFRGREYSVGLAGWTNFKYCRHLWHYGYYHKTELDDIMAEYKKNPNILKLKPLLSNKHVLDICKQLNLEYKKLHETLKYSIVWILVTLGRQSKSKLGKEVNIELFIKEGAAIISSILLKTNTKFLDLSFIDITNIVLTLYKDKEDCDIFETLYILIILQNLVESPNDITKIAKRILWKDATASVIQQQLRFLIPGSLEAVQFCNLHSPNLNWYDTYLYVIETFFKKQSLNNITYSKDCLQFFTRSNLKQIIMTKLYGSTLWTDKQNFYSNISKSVTQILKEDIRYSKSDTTNEIKTCFKDFVNYLTEECDLIIYKNNSNNIITEFENYYCNNLVKDFKQMHIKNITNNNDSLLFQSQYWLVLHDNTYVNLAYLTKKKSRIDIRVQFKNLLYTNKKKQTRFTKEITKLIQVINKRATNSSIRANLIHAADALTTRYIQTSMSRYIMTVHDCFAIDIANVNLLLIHANLALHKPVVKYPIIFNKYYLIYKHFLTVNNVFSFFILL